MKDYREIYGELHRNVSGSSLFGHRYPTNTDDMLREAGIEVYGCDSIQTSQSALFVYMAWKIKELEEKVERLTNKTGE